MFSDCYTRVILEEMEELRSQNLHSQPFSYAGRRPEARITHTRRREKSTRFCAVYRNLICTRFLPKCREILISASDTPDVVEQQLLQPAFVYRQFIAPYLYAEVMRVCSKFRGATIRGDVSDLFVYLGSIILVCQMAGPPICTRNQQPQTGL